MFMVQKNEVQKEKLKRVLKRIKVVYGKVVDRRTSESYSYTPCSSIVYISRNSKWKIFRKNFSKI